MLRVRQIKEVEIEGLGQKIKNARDALRGKKSLEQICNEVGVSSTYWYDLEKEKVKGTLSYENLQKIQEVLGVDLGVNFNQPNLAA